jgi:spore maturation protein CgeB
MKIMVAGDCLHYIYEPSAIEALRKLGHEVTPVSWLPYFKSRMGRLEKRFGVAGPCSRRAQRNLERQIVAEKPDVLLLWRPRNFSALDAGDAKVVVYNNDSPFPSGRSRWQQFSRRFEWRNFLRMARRADLNFVYRESDRSAYERVGISGAQVLLPYYIDWLHRPAAGPKDESLGFVFIGHYEPDGRHEVLAQILDAGVKVSLFGDHSWHQCRDARLADLVASVRPVYGDDYVSTLHRSRVALSFFSKRNNDVYTRRSFEIPGCGIAMLSEQSAALEQILPADAAACYFNSPAGAVEQARRLAGDDAWCREIAQGGRRGVEAGHGIVARMQEMVELIARSGRATSGRT